MLNQFRRIWSDRGKDDKDFTPEDLKLKQALLNLKAAADHLGRAATELLDLINSKA